MSFEDAIRGADVSRTAAYRCWPHKDAFLADLSVELARQAVLVAPTRNEHSATLLRDLVPADGLRTRAQRAHTLETVVRITAADDLFTHRIAGSYRRLIEFFGFRATTDYRTPARIGMALMRGLVIGEIAAGAGTGDTDVAAIAFAGLLVSNIEPADESVWSKTTVAAKIEELAVADFFSG